jgi:hypothetical protein
LAGPVGLPLRRGDGGVVTGGVVTGVVTGGADPAVEPPPPPPQAASDTAAASAVQIRRSEGVVRPYWKLAISWAISY